MTVRVPRLTLIDGVNRTKPFLGTGTLIPIKTVLIPMIKTLSQITNINGYLLVEVQGYNNGTRVIGSNDIDQFSAIVSRYYASPSYTNGVQMGTAQMQLFTRTVVSQ